MVKQINDFFESVINEGTMDDIVDLFSTLKKPLKKVFVLFIIFLIAGWQFSTYIIDFFKSLMPENIMLVAFSPIEVFTSVISLVLLFAVVFTTPFFLYELIKFISPALYAKERRALNILIPISLVLFILGSVFGLFIMAFFGLAFFASMGGLYGITNLWSLGSLINSLTFISFGFGTAFQLPILMIFLVKLDIIPIELLKSLRKYIIIILLIIGAILTPPDVISQLLLALPLYLLYEVTLLYLKVSNKKEEE